MSKPPHPDSPNGLWQHLGYTVERGPRGARTIRRPDGSAVDVDKRDDCHAAEIAAARRELEPTP